MQTKLDENLYSRQLYVLGTDAMKSFQSSSVLIVGMSGLGQEIAKNIILAGIHKVHLHDPKLVTIKDLSTGFYFTQSCINKRRDHCVLSKMRELNPYVNVSVVDDLETMIYTTVIVTNQSYKQLLDHKLHGMFICCQVNGLFSQVFIDFKTFVIKDKNGEPLLQGTINDVTDDVMTVIDEERHQLENNRIRMYRHNSDEVYTCNVKAIDNKRVELIGYTGFDFFGGTYEEIKVPKQMEYLTLNDSIMKPKIMNEDDKAKIIHNCYYLYEEGKDLDSIYKENLENLPFKIYDQEIVKAFEYMHDIEIMPMVSVVGGFVAQEALKSCSGKFTPLNQYYYFDSLECLNYNVKEKEEIRDENNNVVEVKYDYLARYLKQPFEAKETRYYSYEKLFKQNFELLRNSKVFIIGAGAIGCEHLKNIVMSGVGMDGKIYLTDMDSIEQSNLNRQFLFKQKDVNKMKSEIAVREAKNMNEDYQIKKQKNNEETITHYTTKVGSETENVFSDSFYGNLTLIANALDNIEARLYVDSRCVINSVPLFESGTLGTKGNTQVILPHKTESYASSTDPPEKSIPMCTLRNFPHLIEHTIEFALSEFQSYFTDKIVNVKDFFAKQKNDSIKVDTMDDVIDFVKDVPENEKELLRNSFDLFCDNFYVKICKLLVAFPIDSLTKEGIPFWSPPKRAPGPVWFDTKNYVHLMFIKSCALLYAKIFNIKCEIDEDMIIEYFNAHKDEMFDKAKEKLLNTSKTEIVNDGDIRMVVDRKRFTSLEPIEFEKDDDTNHHIDFIFACANIRAQNYKIKEATKLQVKGIAGKIIPAIATTTAMVSGLSVLEMYKYIFDCKFEAFKNTYLTLALPMIASSEPFEPIKKKIEKYDLGLKEYTLWDKIEFEDMKMKDFIEMFKTKYGLEITMISANGKSVFCSFFQQSLYEKNLDKKFGELEHIKEWVTYVCLDCLFSDEDIEVPNLVIKLK